MVVLTILAAIGASTMISLGVTASETALNIGLWDLLILLFGLLMYPLASEMVGWTGYYLRTKESTKENIRKVLRIIISCFLFWMLFKTASITVSGTIADWMLLFLCWFLWCAVSAVLTNVIENQDTSEKAREILSLLSLFWALFAIASIANFVSGWIAFVLLLFILFTVERGPGFVAIRGGHGTVLMILLWPWWLVETLVHAAAFRYEKHARRRSADKLANNANESANVT